MRKYLVLAGLLVGAFTYIYINTVLVYWTDIPEVFIKYWLSPEMMQIVLFSAVMVVPAHFVLVRQAWKKKEIEWSTGVPFFILPYMLGVTAQALVL